MLHSGHSPWRLRCPSGRSARPSSSPAPTVHCSHTVLPCTSTTRVQCVPSRMLNCTRADEPRPRAYSKALFCAARAARRRRRCLFRRHRLPRRGALRPHRDLHLVPTHAAAHGTALQSLQRLLTLVDAARHSTAGFWLQRRTGRRLAAGGLSAMAHSLNCARRSASLVCFAAAFCLRSTTSWS